MGETKEGTDASLWPVYMHTSGEGWAMQVLTVKAIVGASHVPLICQSH
jgi:hypothetical protein